MSGLAITLADLRTDVRTYIDEATANQWTDAAVDMCINYSYWDCLKKIEELCDTLLTAQGDIAFVTNQQEYNLPTGANIVLDVRDNIVDVSIPVLRFSERTFYEAGGWYRPMDWPEGVRVAYLRNGKIGFAPIPDASTAAAVTITYIADQDKLTLTSDSLQIPNKFKELVVLGAVKRLKGLRSEPFEGVLQETLMEQWMQFVALIEARNGQDGGEFRLEYTSVPRKMGFLE